MLFFSRTLLFSSIALTCLSLSPTIQTSDTNIISITKDNIKQELLECKTSIILDIFAPWCPPCQNMKPIFERVAQEFPHIKCATINVDQEPELASMFQISAIPTFILLKDNKAVAAFIGEKSYEDFKKTVDDTLV